MELSGNHIDAIKALKSAILQSRYRAAALVNKELLNLYFAVGKFISPKVEEEKWGTKVIENLSADLQLELPGLRGFSATNIKRMRLFYESWQSEFLISPSLMPKLQTIDLQYVKFSPSLTIQLPNTFGNVSFTHHIELLNHTNQKPIRVFYLMLKHSKKLMD